jgi:16S rRNA G966 N2-methylase RsmD
LWNRPAAQEPKEGMAGQVQMVYIDPPYGIKYGSNFQPFINRADIFTGKISIFSTPSPYD